MEAIQNPDFTPWTSGVPDAWTSTTITISDKIPDMIDLSDEDMKQFREKVSGMTGISVEELEAAVAWAREHDYRPGMSKLFPRLEGK
jgi:hypothetical protein